MTDTITNSKNFIAISGKVKKWAVSFLVGLVVGAGVSVLVALKIVGGIKAKTPEKEIVVVEHETESKKVVTVDMVSKTLSRIGDLTAADLTFTGILKVEDGTIPLFTKKGFSMLYNAHVSAGIDVTKIIVSVDDDTVTVSVPSSEVKVCYVDPKSIEFYDEKKALFNWTDKSDVTDTLIVAEEDLLGREEISDLLSEADSQVELLVSALLEDVVDGRKIVVTRN